MIRVPAHVRSLVRVVAMCSVAGTVLASCATSIKTSPHLTGLPANSISVPLSSVGCTTNNSCVAIGTSDLGVSPTSVGEYRLPNGRWAALSVPNADLSAFLASSSCWSDGCLFVGSQSSGDLVWRYDANTHKVINATAPRFASGVEAASCYSILTCAILDMASGGARFLVTVNGGTTWSSPVALGVPSQDTVTSLSCSSEVRCVATFTNASSGIAIYVTSDGGATWSPKTSPSVTWSTLTSLTCVRRACIGLAKLSSGWRIVRTKNFAKSWSKVASLQGSNLTLACTSLEHCIVGGMTKSSSPWLATVNSGSVTSVKLKYVPSPIEGIACGSKDCAAIAVTTVMELRP
jgi:hypothetical protein